MKVGLFLFVIAINLIAQTNPVYYPEKIDKPIQLDGDLNDAAWSRVDKIDSFVQREPRDNTEPSEKTEVQIAFTDRSIFFGIRCFDSEPDKILYNTMDRDNFNMVQDDQFAFALDTYNDERNGYWFSTNPAGAKIDAQFIDEGISFNSNWDGEWHVAAEIDSLGWTIEIEIPLSTIRYKESDDVIMGLTLFRRIVRKSEAIFSPAIPREYLNGSNTVSRGRKLHFGSLKEVQSFYAMPYVLGGISNEQLLDGSETEFQKDAGLDVKYSITSNLTADLTINTDFAQAEIDNQQVNFSRNQLFYPEKREFFLENSGYFDFGLSNYMQPFFSRRIGIENNQVIPIIAGARLSGKVDDWSLGVLNMQTAKKDSINTTNFSIARVTKEIANRTYIGGLFTNKQVSSNRYNRVVGADLNVAIGENNYLQSFLSKSFTDGPTGNGYIWNIRAKRISEIFGFYALFTEVDADYNPEVGFLVRRGIRDIITEISYSYFIESLGIRKISFVPYNQYITDQNSNLISRSTQFLIEGILESEEQIVLSLVNFHENVDSRIKFLNDFEISPGAYEFNQYYIGFETNGYRPIAGSAELKFGDFYNADILEYVLGINFKLSNQLNMGANFQSTTFEQNGRDFNVKLYDANIKYTFNTEMFASLFVQYNTEDKILQANLRYEWELLNGSKFYLVTTINKTDPISRRLIGDREEVLLKYVHRFDF